MDDESDLAGCIPWLVLLRAPALSHRDLLQLIRTFGDAENVLAAERKELLSHGLHYDTVAYLCTDKNWNIESDLQWLSGADRFFVPLSSPRYPPLLAQIADPPIGLYVRGSVGVLSSTQLAVVGSRNPSADGKRTARFFSRTLAQTGLTVTSGMAVGVDSCSHEAALAAGGLTIGVLGSGLDQLYPACNRKLAIRVVERGALVSEFPIGYKPQPQNFPRRNRIISGLSVGTLVVEAAQRSGSLITARHAAEQGREVFAVPGSIRNPMTRGCHRLIRQGAKLVEQITDIFEEIGPLTVSGRQMINCEPVQEKPAKELDEHAKLLLDNIGYDPISVDELCEITSTAAASTLATLTQLELDGFVNILPGGLFARR